MCIFMCSLRYIYPSIVRTIKKVVVEESGGREEYDQGKGVGSVCGHWIEVLDYPLTVTKEVRVLQYIQVLNISGVSIDQQQSVFTLVYIEKT